MHVPVDKILFFDIETVSQVPQFEALDEEMRLLWGHKAQFLDKDAPPDEVYHKRAGIYAEFGKIICISFGGIFYNEERELAIRVKSFSGNDEKAVLQEFADLLNKHYYDQSYHLCGHNIKEFDIPYVCRRMLINGIALPNIIDVGGKKPWEVRHLDTLQLWKFGDFKNYTSLKLLTKIFGIPSPKGDIDGSEVGFVYWHQKNLARIVAYCQRDVVASVQLYLKMSGKDIIPEANIEMAV